MHLISLGVHSILEEVESRLDSINPFANDDHLLEVVQTGSVLSSSLSLGLHLLDLLLLSLTHFA